MRYKRITNNPRERENKIHSWCYWENVFSDDELKSIIDMCSNFKLEKGKIRNQINDENIRKSNINFFYKNENTSLIFNRFNYIIESINEEYFNFDLNGYEMIQYSEYDSKELGEYKFHMDIDLDEISNGNRKISLTFLLNDDFEGGEFQMNMDSSDIPITIPTEKNKAIIFPSFLIHRVAPVTRGVRKSLVIWVLGPKFR
ncbi:2OG-Fe(II) oxygenase [bacterium]|jgi:PKHD-type hydroxylase|nr:2OG-Fe(II) oxygenase [bacterium]